MKPVLAILAHQSAQPTIDDFAPRWKQLDADLVCYVPLGETITGIDDVRHIGCSAHAGNIVFTRFLQTLTNLLGSPNEWFIVAEYDTVNLRPKLPAMHFGAITSHLVMARPHNLAPGEMQLCSLSPWVMDRRTMLDFIEAGNDLLKTDPNCESVSGLLDRWIGLVIQHGDITAMGGPDMMGYPWHPGAHDRIRWMGFNWIHGFKRASDFGELWKETELTT